MVIGASPPDSVKGFAVKGSLYRKSNASQVKRLAPQTGGTSKCVHLAIERVLAPAVEEEGHMCVPGIIGAERRSRARQHGAALPPIDYLI